MLGKDWVIKTLVLVMFTISMIQPAYAACTNPDGNGRIVCDDGKTYKVFSPEQEKELMKEVEGNRSKELEIIHLNNKIALKDQQIEDLNGMVNFLAQRRAEDQVLINKLVDEADSVWNNYVCPTLSLVTAGGMFAFWEWARNDGDN